MDNGFFFIRAPASGGGGRKIFYPDVVGIKKGRVIMFEVKLKQSRETVYLEYRKFRMLKYVSELAGAEVYLCVYVEKEDKWYAFNLDMLQRIGDKYALYVEMYDKGMDLMEVIRSDKK